MSEPNTPRKMERDQLLALWHGAKQGDFAESYDNAISNVTAWAWSKGPTRWVLPLERELAPEIGRALDSEPKEFKEGQFAYGLDADQQICVMRQIVDPGRGRALGDWMTILSRREGALDWVEYGIAPGRGVRSAATAVLDQDKIAAHHHVTQSTYLCHRYLRDEAGRVVEIEQEQVVSWQAKRRSRRIETQSVFRVTHDPEGLVAIDRIQGQYTYAVYRRPVEGELTQLAKELEDLLVEEVPARAAKLALDEPAYDLALVWSAAADALPPAIAVGVESERERLAPEGLERAPCQKASFASGPLEIHATGGRIVDLALTLASTWPQRTQIELLARAASRLEQVDWTKYLPVTEDFCVYACDMWGNRVA